MTEVIISVISGIVTLAGVIITCAVSNNTMVWRITQLEKKVDKHNNIIERVYKLEQQMEDLHHDK